MSHWLLQSVVEDTWAYGIFFPQFFFVFSWSLSFFSNSVKEANFTAKAPVHRHEVFQPVISRQLKSPNPADLNQACSFQPRCPSPLIKGPKSCFLASSTNKSGNSSRNDLGKEERFWTQGCTLIIGWLSGYPQIEKLLCS